MKTLGIDYGRKKMGLAIAEGTLAEPYKVIRYKDFKTLAEKIKETIRKENIGRVVIGVSEGQMEAETRRFGWQLEKAIGITLEYWDETLTSSDAVRLSIEAGIKRQKRKTLEDAFAAALMLQSFLERRDV